MARAFVLAALCVAAWSGAALAQSVLYVVDEEAPLRAGCSGQAEVLALLPRGKAVRLRDPGESGSTWLRVRVASAQNVCEGFMYQGHLSATPPHPAQVSIFAPPPRSIILAEAADTARSTRSQGAAKPADAEALWAVLDMRLTPEALAEFLGAGGIGEYASPHAEGPQHLARAPQFPVLRPAAPTGREAERQVGLNMAAAVVRRMAKPAFGMALQRYANLVGLAVARYAPGPARPFRMVVLDLPAPVSFSLPGGVVMVSTGLINALENEAQLALILAHEAAHASLGHVWAHALGSQFFRKGGQMTAEGVRSHLFGVMIEDLLVYELSQGIDAEQGARLEYDADAAAVQMAWRAGYDPQQYPRALALIEAAVQASPTGKGQEPPLPWPSLHPPTAERLARLSPLLARLPQSGLALATERFRASH